MLRYPLPSMASPHVVCHQEAVISVEVDDRRELYLDTVTPLLIDHAILNPAFLNLGFYRP